MCQSPTKPWVLGVLDIRGKGLALQNKNLFAAEPAMIIQAVEGGQCTSCQSLISSARFQPARLS